MIGKIMFGVVITAWLLWIYFNVYAPMHRVTRPITEVVESFEEWTDSLTSLEVIK